MVRARLFSLLWLPLLALSACKGDFEWTAAIRGPRIVAVRVTNANANSILTGADGQLYVEVKFDRPVVFDIWGQSPVIKFDSNILDSSLPLAEFVYNGAIDEDPITHGATRFEFRYTLSDADFVRRLDYVNTAAFQKNETDIYSADNHDDHASTFLWPPGWPGSISRLQTVRIGRPRIMSVTPSLANGGTYVNGQTIALDVEFTDEVTVNYMAEQEPNFILAITNVMSATPIAKITSTPSATRKIHTFAYTVVATDTTGSTGLDIADAVVRIPAGATFETDGVSADLTLPASGGDGAVNRPDFKVHVGRPEVMGMAVFVEGDSSASLANETLDLGDRLDIHVQFSMDIALLDADGISEGDPTDVTLDLQVGPDSTDVRTLSAHHITSASGRPAIVFPFEIMVGENGPLNYVAVDSLKIHGVRIVNAARPEINAIRTLRDPSDSESYLRENNLTLNGGVTPPTTLPSIEDLVATFDGDDPAKIRDATDDHFFTIEWDTYGDAAASFNVEWSTTSNFAAGTVSSQTFIPVGTSTSHSAINVEAGAHYYVRVTASKDSYTDVVATTEVDVPLVVLPTYGDSSAGSTAEWNHYVQAAAGDDLNKIADAIACAEGSSYDTCIHAGERRKVVFHNATESTLTACLNDQLIINTYFNDAAGALPQNHFYWSRCEADTPSRTATFYSEGLRPGAGLADFIDFTANPDRIRPLMVKVKNGPTLIAESRLQPWWLNPVQTVSAIDTSSNAFLNLSSLGGGAGTIYTLQDDASTQGLIMDQERQSLVVAANEKLFWAHGAALPDLTATILYSEKNFQWIEGRFGGDSSDKPDSIIRLNSVMGTQIRNSYLTNGFEFGQGAGIRLDGTSGVRVQSAIISGGSRGVFIEAGSTGNFFKDLQIVNSTSGGIFINDSAKNIFSGAIVSNSHNHGVETDATSAGNVFSQLTVHNSKFHNIRLRGTGDRVTAATVGNGGGAGIAVEGGAKPALHSVISTNNAAHGILLDGMDINFADQLATVSQVVSMQNFAAEIELRQSLNNKFYGNLITAIGPVGTDCVVEESGVPGTTPGLDDGCTEKAGQRHKHSTLGSLVSSFGDGTSGAYHGYLSPYSQISNFVPTFGNWLFGVGIDKGSTSTWPHPDYRGTCHNSPSSDECGHYNWALRAGDTQIKNASDQDFGAANEAVTAAPAALVADSLLPRMRGVTPMPNCPDAANGDGPRVFALAEESTRKYLKNAFEFLGDHDGDDDGLCEQFENCIYTPNLGAAQGAGRLVPCKQSTTTVLQADIYYYETN